MKVEQLYPLLKLLNEDVAKKQSCSALIDGAGWMAVVGGHYDPDDGLVQFLLPGDDDIITTVPESVLAIRSRPSTIYAGI
ncbi:hypothetical protein [Sphingomonas sp. ACRSK]|uniref:hypothetical protein n=1 Tax=Sphingomonas sp. ACRSK TaxID=2918213 RepID=UPI001EF6A153|nr:hypothetical protein [Sphingomonas sp. ACRSK]MCG7348826.1 hypothetical protein [Sphingomonas sp. ACRSK]